MQRRKRQNVVAAGKPQGGALVAHTHITKSYWRWIRHDIHVLSSAALRRHGQRGISHASRPRASWLPRTFHAVLPVRISCRWLRSTASWRWNNLRIAFWRPDTAYLHHKRLVLRFNRPINTGTEPASRNLTRSQRHDGQQHCQQTEQYNLTVTPCHADPRGIAASVRVSIFRCASG